MKKGCLVLENGLVFNGEVTRDLSNVMGRVVIQEKEMIVTCLDTQKEYNFQLEGPHKYRLTDGILGKIVTDELPIGYHVYDLKTTQKIIS